MYTHIAMCMGWTFEHIENVVTIPMLDSMNKYWASHPPTHILVAAYLGVGAKKTEPKKFGNDFIADFIAAGGKVIGLNDGG